MIINQGHLESLKPEMRKKLLNLFITNSSEEINNILVGIQNEDLKDIGFFTHKLKGSSQIVGALVINKICKDIEASIQTNDLNMIKTLGNELPNSFKEFEKEVGNKGYV